MALLSEKLFLIVTCPRATPCWYSHNYALALPTKWETSFLNDFSRVKSNMYLWHIDCFQKDGIWWLFNLVTCPFLEWRLEKGGWKEWGIGSGQPKWYGLSVGKGQFSKEDPSVLCRHREGGQVKTTSWPHSSHSQGLERADDGKRESRKKKNDERENLNLLAQWVGVVRENSSSETQFGKTCQ